MSQISDVGSQIMYRSVGWTWGWRSILMLQFQLQFSVAIALSIVISFVVVLSEAAYAIGASNSDKIPVLYDNQSIYLLYAFDIVYFIDLILMTIYKSLGWTDINFKHSPREFIVLMIEYGSLIPLDGMYFVFSDAQLQILYILRLRYAIRIVRLILYYHGTNYIFIKSYVVHIILVVIVVIIVATIASAVSYVSVCDGESRTCGYMDTDLFKQISYTFLSKITEMGVNYENYTTLSGSLLFFIGVIFFLCNMYLVSNFICDIVIYMEEKYFLVSNYRRLKVRVARAGFYVKASNPHKYIKILHDYYDLFWEKRHGINDDFITKNRYLPNIKSKEIFLDLSWIPFQHSHFFREETTHFLRHLSLIVRHISKAPGEIIYQKGHQKSEFIYVASGVVQILSEEDNETPIISLSDGTCFGETCLFVDYKSNSTVICKGYCELAVIHRKDFIKISNLYQRKMRRLLKNTLTRYKYANYFAKLSKLQGVDTHSEGEMHIRWLIYTLRKLLYGDIQGGSRHMVQKLESTIFCTKFLDMLVIAQEIKLVTDTVFLKKSFPWILQPSSPVLIGWNRLITFAFLVHAVCYMYTITVAPEVNNSYIIYHAIISMLWICDLYIEMSTAVQTTEHFLITIKDIISYKSQDFTFLLNIAAAMCPGLLLFLTLPNSSPRVVLLYECNKLLKVYKVEQFFESIKYSSMTKMVFLLYLKFLIYMALLLLYFAGFLITTVCFDWECTESFKTYMESIGHFDPLRVLRFGLLQVINFFCNFLRVYHNYHSYSDLIILQCVFFLFQILFTASRTAAEALRRYDAQNMSNYATRVMSLFKTFNAVKLYYGDAYQNMKLQYQYDSTNFLHKKEVYQVLSKNFLTILREIVYKEDVLKFTIFSGANKFLIEQIATVMRSIILCKSSLVVSQGELCKKMFLLQIGNCIIKYPDGTTKLLKAGDTFCVLETCMQTTSFNRIETITTCQLLMLKFEDYLQIMMGNMEMYQIWRSTCDEFKETVSKESLKILDISYQPKKKSAKKTLLQKLGIYKVKVKRRDFPKWMIGFRSLFMPYTIRSDGLFLIIWEIIGWILGIIAALLVPALALLCSKESNLYSLFLIIDVIFWFDIYLRHHVMYYNPYGIEVSHPYWTACHYWKHSFLLDILACFPFDLTYFFINKGTTIIPFYYRMNRLVRLYRINGIVRYFTFIDINHIKMVESFKFVSLCLVGISITTSIHFMTVCEMYPNCTAKCVSSLIRLNETDESEFSASKYHRLSYLYSASLFLNNYYGFNRLIVRSEENLLMVIGLVGYLFWAYVSSNVIAVNLTRNFYLISYQNAMKDLVKFMSMRRLDKRLKNEIIAHYEYIWHKKQAIKIKTLLAVFPEPIKKSILVEICGMKMLQSDVFSCANEGIIRSLIGFARHLIILKSGIIYRVNDVISELYFIHKGKVEVIGPDGNSMDILEEGSMIGSLDNISMSRQTLTMTAYGHVELLYFPTVEFHKTLSKYPFVYKKFLRFTYMNVDYIKNEKQTVKQKKATKKRLTRIFDRNRWMVFWKKTMVCVAYLNFGLETYHMSTLDHSPILIFLLYLIDFMYLMRIFFKFNTAYIDEFGITIKNKALIAARYKKTSLYFDLISIIPFEMFSIFMLGYSYTASAYAWTYLRGNRLIRIGYTLKYAKIIIHKLNTNAFWVRTMHCTLLLLVYLTSLTSILCFFDSFNYPLEGKSGIEKLKIYLSYLRMMLEMIIKTTITYDLERLHTNFDHVLVFAMVLSKCMAMNYMAQVVYTTQIVNHRRGMFETFSSKLKTFMRLNSLSHPLQATNIEYLSSLWSHFKGEQFPQLLSEAPYYLREGVLNSMFGVHLRSHEVFKKCHVDFIRQVAACFKVARFFPGDIITYIKDIDHCMYFIHKGAVEMLCEDSLYNEEVDDVLIEGQMFGFEQGIYMRIGHEYTYRVKEQAFILVLKREDWIHLLGFFPASKLHLYDKKKEI
nr:uncharacterized protein LOC111428182 [Onthophagus taurus]